MRFLLSLMLAAMPVTAVAQPLQFGGNGAAQAPVAPQPPAASIRPGLQWLQKTPMSLFDLGIMQLSQAAGRAARTEKVLKGGYASYIEVESGYIEITFMSEEAYDANACAVTLQKMRNQMFSPPIDMRVLAGEIGSYFASYGPIAPNQPESTAMDLLRAVQVVYNMKGGACMVTLIDPKINQRAEIVEGMVMPEPEAPAAPAQPIAPKAP